MKVRVLFISLIILCGCVPLIVGGGILTGYVLSNDSASGNLKVAYRDLWDTCIDKLQGDGVEIRGVNESKGRIKARMGDVKLTVSIDSIDQNVQRLKVSARKYLLPKPQVAQEIFFRIVKELE